MAFCNDRLFQNARFTKGKDYASAKYPWMIFQKDLENDLISKIRLTKDFAGQLPDLTSIDMKTLLAKDVIKLYPGYNEIWTSRDCADYWNLTNDTLSFYIKIDTARKPRYPLDEAYYFEKRVEAIDLLISCRSIFYRNDAFVLFPGSEPVFFIDSIRVNGGVLNNYQPKEIAMVMIYKNADSLKITEPTAKNGIVYITTKAFARNITGIILNQYRRNMQSRHLIWLQKKTGLYPEW